MIHCLHFPNTHLSVSLLYFSFWSHKITATILLNMTNDLLDKSKCSLDPSLTTNKHLPSLSKAEGKPKYYLVYEASNRLCIPIYHTLFSLWVPKRERLTYLRLTYLRYHLPPCLAHNTIKLFKCFLNSVQLTPCLPDTLLASTTLHYLGLSFLQLSLIFLFNMV